MCMVLKELGVTHTKIDLATPVPGWNKYNRYIELYIKMFSPDNYSCVVWRLEIARFNILQ